MNKRILGGLLCAAMLCAAPALAMPGMGEGKAPVDKFPMMDADKNGSVSKEEFKKFFPQMQDHRLGINVLFNQFLPQLAAGGLSAIDNNHGRRHQP